MFAKALISRPVSVQCVVQNISRFRLRAHKLSVETPAWDSGSSPLCDRCDCAQVQDKVHALLLCRDVGSCTLRRKYAHLISQFADGFSVPQLAIKPHATRNSSSVSNFLLRYDNRLVYYVSELMELLLTGKDQSQASQSNNLAQDHPM